MSSPPEPTRLHISRDHSLWRDRTSSFEAEQASFRLATAESPDPAGLPDWLAEQTCSGRALLGFDSLRQNIVVNAAVFGPLDRPDATALRPADSAVIGFLRAPQAFAGGILALAQFLLRSEIVRSYAHLHAELCCTGVEEGPETARACFRGWHEYCTHRCHRTALDFCIVLERATGAMRVEGIERRHDPVDLDTVILRPPNAPSDLRVAVRAQDLDAADPAQVWLTIEHLLGQSARFLACRPLPAWAQDHDGRPLQLCRDISAELACGTAPSPLALTVEHLANGQWFVANAEAEAVLSPEEAASLLREALHWCAEPYDDLLPEFAEQVSARLKTAQPDAG